MPLVNYLSQFENVKQFRLGYRFGKLQNGQDARMAYNQNDQISIGIVEQKEQNSHYTFYVKGNPEKLWHQSQYIYLDGRAQMINQDCIDSFKTVNRNLGKRGEKVQGFAYVQLSSQHYPRDTKFSLSHLLRHVLSMKELVFIGIASFHELPKEQVKETVRECYQAGIKVHLRQRAHLYTCPRVLRAAARARLEPKSED